MKYLIEFFDKFSSRDDSYSFRYFARPLSALLLKICGRYFSANQVTYFRLILILIFFILMCLPNIYFFKLGCILFILNIILDNLDGALARKNDNASYWGKFLDGYLDNLALILIPLSGAIRFNIYNSNNLDFILSLFLLFSTIFYLLEFAYRERLVFYREWILKENNKLKLNKFFISRLTIYGANTFNDLVFIAVFAVLFFISIKAFFIIIILLFNYFLIIRSYNLILLSYKNFKIYRKSKFKPEVSKN